MGTNQMKITILVASLFATAIFAPNAEKTIGDDWAIHPFSVAITTLIIMGCWTTAESMTPPRYNRRKGKERKN
jgi:hypothetical protein